MKSILSFLVVAALFALPLSAQEPAGAEKGKQEAAPAKTVEFKRSAPAVGDIVSLAMKSTGSSESETVRNEGEPRVSKNNTKRVVKKKTEILAVSGNVPTKWKVTYAELLRENKREGGGEGRRRGGRGGQRRGQAEPTADLSSLVKQTYIVTIAEGSATVTDAEGKEVKADVARAVKRQELRQSKFAGFGPDVTSIIPAGKMKLGQTVEVPAEMARSLIGNAGRGMARGGRGGG